MRNHTKVTRTMCNVQRERLVAYGEQGAGSGASLGNVSSGVGVPISELSLSCLARLPAPGSRSPGELGRRGTAA